MRFAALAKPDCSQLDAVLAAVKAWPGEAAACARRHATASLDGVEHEATLAWIGANHLSASGWRRLWRQIWTGSDLDLRPSYE